MARVENYPDKGHFTVFDCFGGSLLERFKQATGITAESPTAPSRSILQILDDIWAGIDRPCNIKCLVKRLQRIDKEMDRAKACPELIRFGIAEGDLAKYAEGLPAALRRDFTGSMKLLLDPDFRKLRRRPFRTGEPTARGPGCRFLSVRRKSGLSARIVRVWAMSEIVQKLWGFCHVLRTGRGGRGAE